MGDDFSAENCIGGSYEDDDQDDMGDQCEWALARRFAPVMTFDSYDDVGREPYFAVRPLSSTRAVILYMPAYYVDLGCGETQSELCGVFDDGHLGDSEAIGAVVEFSAGSEHWVLKDAYLSAHGSHRHLHAGNDGYPGGLEYPDEIGGRFMVHVAYGKHANYETRTACNASSGDVCNNSASTGDTLFVDLPRNIGSYDHQLKNCVYSLEDPYNNYVECFWTGYPGYNRFFGWAGPDGDGCSPYAVELTWFGFIDE